MVRLWGRVGGLLLASLVVVSLLFVLLDDMARIKQPRPYYNIRSLKTKPLQTDGKPSQEKETTTEQSNLRAQEQQTRQQIAQQAQEREVEAQTKGEQLQKRVAEQSEEMVEGPAEEKRGEQLQERVADQSKESVAGPAEEKRGEQLQERVDVKLQRSQDQSFGHVAAVLVAASEQQTDPAADEKFIGKPEDATELATTPLSDGSSATTAVAIIAVDNNDKRDLSAPAAVEKVHGHEILRVGPRPLDAASLRAPPPLERALFSYQDLFAARPVNVRASVPVQYGLNMSIARLNYEFSGAAGGGGSPFAVAAANRINFRPPAVKKPSRMGIVGNIPVGEPVPVRAARHILIATTWRSGSTFLGDLLNHYPGTFYYFEPLHWTHSLGEFANTVDIGQLLRSLFRCEFSSKNLGYLHHVAKYSNRFLVKHNFRLWNTCHNLLPKEMMCFMPDYMSAVCPTFPIKLIKTVRLRVANTEELLADKDLNLKVIMLVRDPRGVYASRNSGPILNWCKNEQCANPEIGCTNLMHDLKAAEDLGVRYPGRVLLLRYEDLSIQPEATTRNMLKFLGLPWTKEMKQFLATHTSKDKPKLVKNTETNRMEKQSDPYATSRNSTATAFKWRESLTWANISAIQELCREPMESLGYKLLEENQQLLSGISPLQAAGRGAAAALWG